MRQLRKVLLFTLVGTGFVIGAMIVAVLVYCYVNRDTPVLYQTHSVDIAPMLFIQNPFRDMSRELVADNFLESIRGKTVTESLRVVKDVRFNNPSGFVEQGELVSWELSNRADRESSSTFYYFIYRGNPDKPVLSFATVTVEMKTSGWSVSDYKGLGDSNNS